MRPTLPVLLVLAALTFAGGRPLSGQGPRLPPAIPTYRITSFADSSPPKTTYWAEGGAIGALAAVLLMTSLYEGSDDKMTLVMLVGGFVIGALVGGGIEKKSGLIVQH